MESIDHYDNKYWKNIKNNYNLLRRREKVALELVSKVSGKIKSPSILDAGSGDGRFIVHIKSKVPGSVVYGADYSKEGVKISKEHGLNVKQADFNVKIPYNDKSFDLVHSAEVIEHLYNPDKLLEEANRVLKDKGFLIISTPNLCAWFNRILFLFGIHPLYCEVSTKSSLFGLGLLKGLKSHKDTVGHVRVFSYMALKDIICNYGFEIVDVRTEVFEDGPKYIFPIDKVFSFFPSLSSHLIIVARKVK